MAQFDGVTAVRTPTTDPGRVPRHASESADAAPELLTFLDAAHRRIAELEEELAFLRGRYGDRTGGGVRRRHPPSQ